MKKPDLTIRRVRDFGTILSDTFQFLKDEFKPLYRAVLFIGAPVLLLSGILQGAFFQSFLGIMGGGIGGQGDMFYGDVTNIVVLFLYMLTVFASSALLTAIVNAYFLLKLEQATDFSTAVIWQKTKQLLPKMLGLYLTIMLITVIITIIGGVMVAGLGVLSLFLSFFVVMIAVLVGMFLLSPLFIIFTVQAVEGLSVSDCFERCFNLGSGYRFSILGIVIVMGLVAAFAQQIFSIPLSITTVISTVNTVEQGNQEFIYELFGFISGIVNSFGQFVTAPVSLVAIALMYFNLVERKEAIGLMAEVEKIGLPEEEEEDLYFS